MTAVLVTGGTGFVGQHLVRALRERGQEVRVLIRPAENAQHQRAVSNLASLGAEQVVGDILDPTAVRRAVHNVSTVFHLAGRLLIPGIAPEEYQRLHVDGTRTLLDACAELPLLHRIVHCSTTGVLGPTGTAALGEDARLRPSTIYEHTKAQGEQLAIAMAHENGLPLTVIRPALVYGPGDRHLLGWFRAIQKKLYRVVGRGDNTVHPIYIHDLVDGILRCIDVPAAVGRVYHLVGERALPIRELAAAIARAVGTRLPRQHLPLPLAWAIASVLEALPGLAPERLPLTRSRVAFMTESRAYCGDRARDELGFVPRVTLETGLQHTVAWYRSENLL